jgi:transcriptional regulator with XRE-family HTH domain
VRSLLEQSGHSMRSLSEEAGLSASQLHGYLSGKNTPGLDVADRIANALKVSLSDLLESGEEPELEPWAQVPRPLLVALSQVHEKHYPIIQNFLESFTLERERSKVSEVTKGLEKPGRDRNKRSK